MNAGTTGERDPGQTEQERTDAGVDRYEPPTFWILGRFQQLTGTGAGGVGLDMVGSTQS
jgi:hypothetical protein